MFWEGVAENVYILNSAVEPAAPLFTTEEKDLLHNMKKHLHCLLQKL